MSLCLFASGCEKKSVDLGLYEAEVAKSLGEIITDDKIELGYTYPVQCSVCYDELLVNKENEVTLELSVYGKLPRTTGVIKLIGKKGNILDTLKYTFHSSGSFSAKKGKSHNVLANINKPSFLLIKNKITYIQLENYSKIEVDIFENVKNKTVTYTIKKVAIKP